MMKFSENLIQVRKKQGLTQETLAEQLDVSIHGILKK